MRLLVPQRLARMSIALEGPALSTVFALPPKALRAFAGRPRIVDGHPLDLEMQAILRLEQLAGGRSVELVPPEEARANTDRHGALVGGEQPIGRVFDLDVPGPGSGSGSGGTYTRIGIRVYVPSAAVRHGPLLVYFHGGGWVVGSLDSHDAVCRFLAERAGVRVVAVDYRLAPEHRFPGAVEDCWAAFSWVCDNAESLGADPERIAVGGDSAGGNLAAVVSLLGRDRGLAPAFQLLLYPATDRLSQTESRRLFPRGFYLTAPMIDYYVDMYVGDATDKVDPRVSPLRARDVSGLCPAYVMTAGFDPLRDEGEAYARRLADAGVPVESKRFPGMIHGFVNMVGVGTSAPAAMAEVADALRKGLRA